MHACSSLPQVKDFIDKKASKIKGLRISYSNGATPKLRLAGGEGQASEMLRIDNWKASAIEDFLKERLA